MPELPLPAHFDPSRVGQVWRVPYEDRAREAPAWADEYGLGPAAEDAFRLCLLAVDVQTIWPYHAMLGGIGHVLVPAVEEASDLIEKLLTFDAVVVAGQAKSHCFAWTIDDLLEDERARQRRERSSGSASKI